MSGLSRGVAALVLTQVILGAGEGGEWLPPPHPFLVDSPFPAVHHDAWRQCSTALRGLEAADQPRIAFTPTPLGKTSPWIQWSAPYADGSRTLIGRTNEALFKAVVDGPNAEVVATFATAKRALLPNWSFLQLAPHRFLIRSQEHDKLLIVTDGEDPRSPFALEREVILPAAWGTEPQKLMRLYDGSIAYLTKDGVVGVLDAGLTRATTVDLGLARGEVSWHNDMAADADGSILLVTDRRMIGLRWDGRAVVVQWSAPFDFGGSRLQACGTTPTLLGGGDDALVVVCDSNQPAHLVAFWRSAIPANWRGLPGQDRRVAGLVELPGCRPASRLFAAVENSPCARDWSIACAQFNGVFGQGSAPLRGVWRASWDPQTDRFALDWANQEVTCNGVLTLSSSSGLLYGSGREADGTYCYYGLDWTTGRVALRVPLGTERRWDDPGCANIIGLDRSLTFGTLEGLVRIVP